VFSVIYPNVKKRVVLPGITRGLSTSSPTRYPYNLGRSVYIFAKQTISLHGFQKYFQTMLPSVHPSLHLPIQSSASYQLITMLYDYCAIPKSDINTKKQVELFFKFPN